VGLRGSKTSTSQTALLNGILGHQSGYVQDFSNDTILSRVAGFLTMDRGLRKKQTAYFILFQTAAFPEKVFITTQLKIVN
jgi:hypothetical protein